MHTTAMNALDDSLNAILEHTVAAISMTGEILLYGNGGNDHADEECHTFRTLSSSTEERPRRSVRSLKRRKRRFGDDMGSLPYEDWLFSFFFQEGNVAEKPRKRERGRSLYRRKNDGMPTNAARPATIHHFEPEAIEVEAEKGRRVTHGRHQRFKSLEPENIYTSGVSKPEIYKPEIHRPQFHKPEKIKWPHAMLRIGHYWSQKRANAPRNATVYLLESVDTFDMMQELAEMKNRRSL
jgi:hypothetical protein